MDFICGLTKTPRKNDVIWVIINRLTKLIFVLSIKWGSLLKCLAREYVKEIIKLHGVPVSIVSDRDLWFTDHFQEILHEALGMKLHFSTVFHPQTDG